MKNLHTEITIDAPAEKVWQILTAFAQYPQWNPFVLSISGEPVKGTHLRVELKNGNGVSVFKPVVLAAEVNRAFEWRGSLPVPGLFTGHHYFRIVPVNTRQVNFIHGENFSGLLAGMLLNKIGEATRQGFMAMNHALKQEAEKTGVYQPQL